METTRATVLFAAWLCLSSAPACDRRPHSPTRVGAADAGRRSSPARDDAGGARDAAVAGDAAQVPGPGSGPNGAEDPAAARMWRALGAGEAGFGAGAGRGEAEHARAVLSRAARDVLAAPEALADPEGYARGLYAAGTTPYERELSAFAPVAAFFAVYVPYREGGRAAVEALLATPPATTEQLLHPERRAAGEGERAVGAWLPAALSGTYATAYDDTLGELGAARFFAAALPRSLALSAAQGWGGDRAVLALPRSRAGSGPDAGAGGGSAELVLWSVVLDAGPAARPDAEAVEFADAAGTVLSRRHAGGGVHVPGAVLARSAGGAVGSEDARVALVARAGRRVLVAEGVPAARAADVVRAFVAGGP